MQFNKTKNDLSVYPTLPLVEDILSPWRERIEYADQIRVHPQTLQQPAQTAGAAPRVNHCARESETRESLELGAVRGSRCRLTVL